RIAAADTNAEWVSYGKGYSEQRFSPLDKINATNVGQLGLAWYAQFDTDRGQEATPLVVDGVLYTTTAWSKVFAYDAATGKKLWRFYTLPNATGTPDGEPSDKVLKEKALATWPDGSWKQVGGGGTVWDSIVYDPQLNLIYFGVDNGTPWDQEQRSG